MTSLETIQKKIAETREIVGKATKAPWDRLVSGQFDHHPFGPHRSALGPIHPEKDIRLAELDSKCLAHTRNHIESYLDALELAVNEFDRIILQGSVALSHPSQMEVIIGAQQLTAMEAINKIAERLNEIH